MKSGSPQIFRAHDNNGLSRTLLVPALFLILSGCGLTMDSADRLDRAAASYAEEDYRAAVIDAKEVLRKEPDNLRGRVLLGRALVKSGDGAGAEKEFRRAMGLGADPATIIVDLGRALESQNKSQQIINEVDLDLAADAADRADLQIVRGTALLRLEQPQEAREFFQAALSADETLIEAKLGVVSSHIAEQNLMQARGTMDEVIGSHPRSLDAWLASGDLNLKMGNAGPAVSDFDNALSLVESDTSLRQHMQALDGMADALLRGDRLADATDVAKRMKRLSPDSVSTLFLEGRIAYEQQQWSDAQDSLRRVLQIVPEFRPAQLLLGAVQLETGNLSQAEMYLSAVVGAMPDNRQARMLLAETRLQRARMSDAQQALEPLLQRDADSLALSMAARASAGQGNTSDAVSFLEQGLGDDPGNTELLFQLAMTQLSGGRYDAAQDTLAQIEVAGSADTEFRRDAMLVMTRVRADDVREAVDAAKLLTQRWPDNDRSHLLLGSLYMSQNNLADARKSFDAAARLSDYSPVTRRYLASLDEVEGDLVSARAHYDAVLEAYPDTGWALASLARIASKESDSAQSLQWTERLVEVEPGNTQQRMLLARKLYEAGEFSQSADAARAVLEQDPSVPEAHFMLGLALVGLEDYLGATNSFRRASDLEPEEPSYRLNAARAQMQQGSSDLAIQTLFNNGRPDIQDIPSAAMLAGLLANAGDSDAATRIVSQMKSTHSNSAIPYAVEAEILLGQGDLEGASAVYDKALGIEPQKSHALRAHSIKTELGAPDAELPLLTLLDVDPEDDQVRLMLASYLQTQGSNAAAIEQYEVLRERDPQHVVVLNNLAWLYFIDNDNRAESLARKAYSLRPGNASIVDTLGWILVRTGSVDEGVRLLRKALDLASDNPEIRYHLAHGLAEQGRPDEARALLQEALSGSRPFSSRAQAEQLLASL